MEQSAARLPREACVTCGPPPKFAHAERAQKRGKTVFHSDFWRFVPRGELRCVSIVSPAVEIVNLFFFPEAAYVCPIYAMEFVRIGKKGVVGVIDCKAAPGDTTAQEAVKTILSAGHERFPQLENGADPPLWYQDARSGFDFFVRPQNLEVFADLIAAHHFCWTQFAEFAASAEAVHDEPSDPRRAGFLRSYKDHHRDNSPGIPFLNRVFGEAWTRDFLHDALFA